MRPHPLDTLTLRYRRQIQIAALAVSPVFLLTYGAAMRAVFVTWPWWLVLTVALVHCLTAIGIASRLDMLSERQTPTEPGR